MDTPRRKGTPPEVHALAEAKARLERDNVDLKALTMRLEQRTRFLQVTVALLLGITLGLAVGLTTSLTGSGIPAALGSATGVLFAVTGTSLAVLSYIRH
jgi:hypothetical protein